MKICNFIAGLAIFIFCGGASFLSQVMAASTATASLTLKGNVTEQTCELGSDSEDIYVDLGSWDTASLNARVGNTTTKSAFIITLANCPVSDIQIKFAGTTVGTEGLLAIDGSGNAGVASNVAIELLDSDSSHLAINTLSRAVTVNSDGAASFTFYARYKSLASEVSGGTANASATFSFTYQ